MTSRKLAETREMYCRSTLGDDNRTSAALSLACRRLARGFTY